MFLRLQRLNVLFTWALLALFVASCQAPAPKIPEAAYTTSESHIHRGQRLVDEALELPSPERDRQLLEAAELFFQGKAPKRAESSLQKINGQALETPQFARYALLYADLLLSKGQFFQARQLLGHQRFSEGPTGLGREEKIHWHGLRGELYALLGETNKSLFEYSRLATLLDNPTEIRAIHDKIWANLSHLSDEEIHSGITYSNDADLAGWHALAQVSRDSQGDIARLVEGIAQWRKNNKAHPAASILPSSLQKAAAISKKLPKNIALLLPGSGDLSIGAEAIREGFLAAYFEAVGAGSNAPNLSLYDTQKADIALVYKKAIDEGAELVIGPLGRDALTKLMAEETLSIPVLGLNYLEDVDNRHDNLYQFGLSLNDEVRQIAERAWIAEQRVAITITPNTSWGDGALESFKQVWASKGGRIVASTRYELDQQDYAPALEPVLLLRQSSERAQRLKRLLGMDFSYAVHRRGDIDLILLIAYPQNGRQIKPTLDFLYAGDVPIYATSHIYDGSPRPARDHDLNGIVFSAMPWTIEDLARGSLRPSADLPPAYRNLFALGHDSYRLHQWLELLKTLPETEIHGNTGNLFLGAGNRIARIQPWAEFHLGRVRPLQLPATGSGP